MLEKEELIKQADRAIIWIKEYVKKTGAKGVIVNIAGSAEMPLDEINAIMTVIGDRVDNPEANIIFGTIIDDSLQDEIVITVIATGIEK